MYCSFAHLPYQIFISKLKRVQYFRGVLFILYLILNVIQENQSLLGVTNQNSPEWRLYTEYVDQMIVTGFFNAIRCSLQYFVDNTDAAQRITPLFEIKLMLSNNEMTFDPSLDVSLSGNFYGIVDKMVTNIINMASFISRVANHKDLDNYQVLCLLVRVLHG